MNEHLILTIIGCATGLIAITTLMLTATGSEHDSTLEKWIAARKEIKLKQLEVAKLEAEHLQKCPRLTDTPRER